MAKQSEHAIAHILSFARLMRTGRDNLPENLAHLWRGHSTLYNQVV